MAEFQSTPSTQRETILYVCKGNAGSNISIHSLYAEGDVIAALEADGYDISIHSLYAEGDEIGHWEMDTVKDFNPLPLRRGRP